MGVEMGGAGRSIFGGRIRVRHSRIFFMAVSGRRVSTQNIRRELQIDTAWSRPMDQVSGQPCIDAIPYTTATEQRLQRDIVTDDDVQYLLFIGLRARVRFSRR